MWTQVWTQVGRWGMGRWHQTVSGGGGPRPVRGKAWEGLGKPGRAQEVFGTCLPYCCSYPAYFLGAPVHTKHGVDVSGTKNNIKADH